MTADYKEFADDVAKYLKIDTTKGRITIDAVKTSIQKIVLKSFEKGVEVGEGS